MQQYTSPGEVVVAPEDNAVSALVSRSELKPKSPALAYRDGDRFVNVATEEFVRRARAAAAGLVGLGIESGDRVAVYSGTRLDFIVAQYAVWMAGAVLVTIYETSSAEQVHWIMSDSGSVLLIAENADLKATFDSVAADLNECRNTFLLDEGGLDAIAEHATDESRQVVGDRISDIGHDDLALLIYTSGTTGMPKGCMLTHGNFAWTFRQVSSEMPDLFAEGNSTLMFLPLAHSFAQVVQVGCVASGVTIGFATSTQNLVEELGMFHPRWVFAVPRVFEKVFNTAKMRADADGKGRIFDAATKVAIGYSKQQQEGGAKLVTKLAHGLFDKLVFGKIRDVFGGQLVYAISGGAPLGKRLGYFFKGIGLTVLEGYGLTETTAASFFNRPGDVRIGTVGRPASGGSVSIAADGEVLIKSGGVFRGYWNNQAATDEVFADGDWFHTGDVGSLDNEGFLSITGRKKELIVTAGGKNVAPAVLEDRIRAHQLVSQCLVVGDARPFISALVTVDPETYPAWAEEHNKSLDVGAMLDDVDLRAELQEAIDDANRAVSKAESIRTFRILPDDFTIEGGELTPTLKVKRGVVSEKYASIIDGIYT